MNENISTPEVEILHQEIERLRSRNNSLSSDRTAYVQAFANGISELQATINGDSENIDSTDEKLFSIDDINTAFEEAINKMCLDALVLERKYEVEVTAKITYTLNVYATSEQKAQELITDEFDSVDWDDVLKNLSDGISIDYNEVESIKVNVNG